MARQARVVAAGLPHHVTRRGNRRQAVFLGKEDFRLYRDLLAQSAAAARVGVWAWCRMPNHVHLILVPATPDGLVRALQDPSSLHPAGQRPRGLARPSPAGMHRRAGHQ